MLGGGNPVGANPAGIGNNLNYIGNHAYAYSGMFSANTSAQTMLKFDTGNQYTVAKLTVTGVTENLSNLGNGSESCYTVKINGEDIYHIKMATDQEDSPSVEVVPILLEPFSKIEVSVVSGATNANLKSSVTIVGRVY